MVEEYPQFLFHYTSIKVLSLILESKTIRFGRLDTMDDPLEGQVSDVDQLARYFFASSWTDNHAESIRMWGKYAGLKGVRIELPAFPFYYYRTDGTPVEHGQIEGEKQLSPFSGPLRACSAEGLRILFDPDSAFLVPIKYWPMEKVKQRTFLVHSMGNIGLSYETAATHKSDDWALQMEWRYIIRLIPLQLLRTKPSLDGKENKLTEIYERAPVNFDVLFMTVSNRALNELRITLGPHCSSDERHKVNTIIAKAGLDPSLVSDSKLVGTTID